MVHQNIVDAVHLPGRLPAEAPHRRRQGKHPNRRANRHVFVVLQIAGYRLNGHIPTVHAIPAAPPEPQRTRCALGRTDFIDRRAGAVGLLPGQFLPVSHAGEKHHQPPRIFSDMAVIRKRCTELLLLREHPGCTPHLSTISHKRTRPGGSRPFMRYGWKSAGGDSAHWYPARAAFGCRRQCPPQRTW